MKTLYISILFLSIFCISCAKEEITPEPPVAPEPPTTVIVPEVPATIIGVWEYSKQVALNNGVETLIDYPHTAGCAKNYFIITPNGFLYNYAYFKDADICKELLFTSKYVLNNQTLTVTPSIELFGISVYQILSLTKQEMKVTISSGMSSSTYILKRL
jgi:hypothetical protein